MVKHISEQNQRQLRVGEIIRQGLCHILMEKELYLMEVEQSSVVISEIRMSPDLKHATVYTSCLFSDHKEHVVEALNANSSHIRHLLGRHVDLRSCPHLNFRNDDVVDHASKIEALLRETRKTED